jgi:hypothetical protein
MRSILHDFQYAARQMMKSPGFAVIAIAGVLCAGAARGEARSHAGAAGGVSASALRE